MNLPEDTPELLNTVEVAKIFRVSRNTVVAWASRGLLEHTRTPSGQFRFFRRSVEQVLRDSHRGGHAGPGGEGTS
jgi:excisionase family DNA binding protein